MKKIKPYYQIISCFFFSLLGVQIKLSLLTGNIENIVFHRSLMGSLILLIITALSKKKFLNLIATRNLKIHLIRCLCGILAMYFGYKSLIYLTLAQASTIGFSKVFFTCILSVIFFSEKLSLKTILLIISGFFGILLITNPSQINESTGVYMSLFSAMCVAGGIISISYLSKREETITILLYQSIVSTIIFFIFFKNNLTLSFDFTALNYFFITVTALTGQFFNTESYKNYKTNNIVILSYTRIIFSSIFGFLFFDEQIGVLALLGILIVILTTFNVQKK